MIPLRDNIPSRTVPVMNYLLIAACVGVFFLQLGAPHANYDQQYGLVPARVMHPDAKHVLSVIEQVRTPLGIREQPVNYTLPPAAVPNWLTLLSCIFLHGGLMHLLGNMWFMFIFGDNVEDRLGHVGYLLFYLVCGAAASATQLAVDPDSTMPTIGASGAIAGVMGAYFYLYPRAMVLTLVPIVFLLQMLVIPAPLFLGIWFLMQFLQRMPGVAWWAHIGGFVAGLVIVIFLGRSHRTRPPVEMRRPRAERMGYYRVR